MFKSKLTKLLDTLKYYSCVRCDVRANGYHIRLGIKDLKGRPTIHRRGTIFEQIDQSLDWTACNIIEHSFQYIQTLDEEVFHNNGAITEIFEKSLVEHLNNVKFVESPDLKHLRILQYLYSMRSSIFLRHGVEIYRFGQYAPHSFFPDSSDLQPFAAAVVHGAYAIDTDMPPFLGCSMHSQRYGRDGINPWVFCAGYISLDRFQHFCGEILKFDNREHFYAISNIPIEEWFFIWAPQHFANARNRIHKSNVEMFEASIETLSKGPSVLLERGLVQLYFETADLLQQRLDLMKIARQVRSGE